MKKPCMLRQVHTSRYGQVASLQRWEDFSLQKPKKAPPVRMAMTPEQRKRWEDATRQVYGKKPKR